MSLPGRISLSVITVVGLLPAMGAVSPATAAAKFLGNFGLGYDLTNQIYFEQTFDSTAFTGRKTVSDPQGRLLGLTDLMLR